MTQNHLSYFCVIVNIFNINIYNIGGRNCMKFKTCTAADFLQLTQTQISNRLEDVGMQLNCILDEDIYRIRVFCTLNSECTVSNVCNKLQSIGLSCSPDHTFVDKYKHTIFDIINPAFIGDVSQIPEYTRSVYRINSKSLCEHFKHIPEFVIDENMIVLEGDINQYYLDHYELELTCN